MTIFAPKLAGFYSGFLQPVRDYRVITGATDIKKIDYLARQVWSEGLWPNFRIYPQKSTQNASSGTTQYGLGGLTANHMTLVGSPTRGTTGLTLNGTSQYGHITDFLGTETLTIFGRVALTTVTPSGDSYIFGQYNAGAANDRSVAHYLTSTGELRLPRSSDGTTTNFEIYSTAASTATTNDTCNVCQWIAGGGRSLWLNKTSQSISLVTGSAQTNKKNSAADITMGCLLINGSPSLYTGGVYKALAFATGTITTAQRELITDLINAL